MSIYDDMFELDRHFKILRRLPSKNKKHNKALSDAWDRISESYAESERYEIKVEPVIRALVNLFDAFGVVRNTDNK